MRHLIAAVVVAIVAICLAAPPAVADNGYPFPEQR